MATAESAGVAPVSSAKADIISTIGLTIVSAPTIVTGGFILNSGGGLPPQSIFAEQKNVTLVNPLITDTGTIPAGGDARGLEVSPRSLLQNELI